jgi:hypothetical protein
MANSRQLALCTGERLLGLLPIPRDQHTEFLWREHNSFLHDPLPVKNSRINVGNFFLFGCVLDSELA